MGAASRWWLHHSLKSLNDSLSDHLIIRPGDARDVLPQLVRETGARAVYWNRCYEPWRIKRDAAIKDDLQGANIETRSFNASLLWEPHRTLKDDGTPYKVFTPFYRKGCLGKNGEPPEPLPAPERLTYGPSATCKIELGDLELLPKIRWYGTMEKSWSPGETGALKRLEDFCDNGLKGYKEGRNYPDHDNVSRLSAHLHFGEISPRTAWHSVRRTAAAEGWEADAETFCSELGWREFSYSLLTHFPELPEKPLQDKFSGFPWDKNDKALERWQRGETGYPIVDAGMRELWATGYMHNRVRMIVASFLIKDLLLHWTEGERWFWDTLVDADLANNAASWQWVAGSGADAAPYFRIFNPVTQGQKFDPDGAYVRQWIPELSKLPGKRIHAPWECDEKLAYPAPIVDHSEARKRALDGFAKIKGG